VLVVWELVALVLVAVLVEEEMEEEELVQGQVHRKDNHTCRCSTSFLCHIA